ncbi:hypothetical protein [Acidianus sp. HS-5]|uniref:hypothetical protein n=1 Tax=Acidianus sp. HS-5 TaxID=2886040 RepID=UPI001F293298|nr:hypothetical protein [Acidianus sp. HS-5]BDC19707.1 hypothetical protein HS5_25970 [Acidianus sp. HS-5]
MISEKLISDLKFYDKPLGIFFTADNCNDCEELLKKIKELPISRRFIIEENNSLEFPEYLNRLTRGIIPTLSILSPELKILGILESNDIKEIESKLREIAEAYYKGYKGESFSEFAPEPVEAGKEVIYNVMDALLASYPADFRMTELYNFISSVNKDYSKAEKVIKPLNDISEFLLNKKKIINTNSIYATEISFYVMYGLRKVEDLLQLIGEDGIVYRSTRKQNKGLLVDEAMTGNALLTQYENTLNEEYLNYAKKIYDFIINNLNHEKGFRDTVIKDELTKITFLEPLANSEAGIFFARYWAVTGEEKSAGFAKKAINCAYAGSSDPRVLARISIALIKLQDLIRTNEKGPYTDLRMEFSKQAQCKYFKDGKCYEKLDEIKFLDF